MPSCAAPREGRCKRRGRHRTSPGRTQSKHRDVRAGTPGDVQEPAKCGMNGMEGALRSAGDEGVQLLPRWIVVPICQGSPSSFCTGPAVNVRTSPGLSKLGKHPPGLPPGQAELQGAKLHPTAPLGPQTLPALGAFPRTCAPASRGRGPLEGPRGHRALPQGGDLWVPNCVGLPPQSRLAEAAWCHRPETLKFLIEAGCKLDPVCLCMRTHLGEGVCMYHARGLLYFHFAVFSFILLKLSETKLSEI